MRDRRKVLPLIADGKKLQPPKSFDEVVACNNEDQSDGSPRSDEESEHGSAYSPQSDKQGSRSMSRAHDDALNAMVRQLILNGLASKIVHEDFTMSNSLRSLFSA
jgi:hypothetical protein